jgi:hypothetical protein
MSDNAIDLEKKVIFQFTVPFFCLVKAKQASHQDKAIVWSRANNRTFIKI